MLFYEILHVSVVERTSCFHEALEIRQGSIKTQLLVTSFNKWQRILLHVRGKIVLNFLEMAHTN
jgi:hypothetical protein